jgi:hypothetical protein
MAYKIGMLQDNILRVTFEGELNQEDMEGYLQEYNRYLANVSETEPLLFLVNSAEVTKVSASARKYFVQVLRQPDPRTGRTAMVGSSRYVRVLTGFILKAVGRDDIQLFDTEEQGLAWLKEGQ